MHFICQFEPTNKNSNPRGFLQSAQPYSSKSQFENGRRAPAFEPFAKISKDNPEKGEVETEIDKTGTANEKVETENDKFNSENFVTDIKIADVKTSQIKNEKEKTNSNTVTTKTANEKFKPESREELNTNIKSNVKTKNKQTTKTKTKIKANPPTIQKYSNHIEFIDYIPTHELITYRHLFAYGFYVE